MPTATTTQATATAAESARLHRLFADPTRVGLVRTLAERGEMRVGALCEALGTEQTATSHALAILRAAGVVEDRREGRAIHYRLAEGLAERFAPTLLYPLCTADE